jgi:hypothetical protein
MGANPKQALAFLLFLVGFTVIAEGLFLGGNFLILLLGVALLGVSLAIFLKAKPLEHIDG